MQQHNDSNSTNNSNNPARVAVNDTPNTAPVAPPVNFIAAAAPSTNNAALQQVFIGAPTTAAHQVNTNAPGTNLQQALPQNNNPTITDLATQLQLELDDIDNQANHQDAHRLENPGFLNFDAPLPATNFTPWNLRRAVGYHPALHDPANPQDAGGPSRRR